MYSAAVWVGYAHEKTEEEEGVEKQDINAPKTTYRLHLTGSVTAQLGRAGDHI